MDYKEKYEQALEVAKETYNKQPMYKDWLESMFPELKESEDERIRKAIHIYLDWLDGRNKDYQPKGDYSIKDMLAWLEKQGEKKNRKASYTAIAETGNGGINALITRDIEIPFGAKDSELQEATYYIPKGYHVKIEGNKVVYEQKSQRIISAEAKEAMYGKPAWSEEDEEHIDSLLKRLDGLCRNEFERTRFAINEDGDWLKSLKQRIGG